MDCAQVNGVMEKNVKIFNLCLPLNLLRIYFDRERPCIFIVLMSNKGENIGHFISIYLHEGGGLTLFDPLGIDARSDIDVEILKLIKPDTPLQFNRKKIQGPNSCLCAVYCIFVSLYLSRNYSFNAVLSWFGRDRAWNDASIYSFFSKRLSPSMTVTLTPARMLRCRV